MYCPVCKENRVKVIDSRAGENNMINRKRECTECLTRFDTKETIIFESLPKYIREKILDGDLVD